MGKVRILDEATANRIAAGEVVERPASVVKELVENAIDADSTKVDVYVEEGGLKSIRVRDNGTGMDEEDCETAFLRHATSKIARTNDLFRIVTLGFRGEALPSIAAVAKVECLTSARDDGLGQKVVIHGGKMISRQEIAMERGTDIRVTDLFYNTPARLKYMKTVQTELGHISDFMHRLALARPDIAFSLTHNQNTLVSTPGNGDMRQIIAAIYGLSAAKKMIPVEKTSLDFTLNGWISLPEWTRASRTAVTTIVNGRYVSNFGLVKAVLEGYHTLLPLNRYPLTVLHITMDPGLIDVNVHPSKLEVKFSKEKELYAFVEQAVREALGQRTLIPSARSVFIKEKKPIQQQIEWTETRFERANLSGGFTPARDSSFSSAGEGSLSPAGERRTGPAMWQEKQASAAKIKEAVRHYLPDTAAGKQDEPKEESAITPQSAVDDGEMKEREEQKKPRFPYLYPIGQMRGTYIIAQNEDGLYLIDQHAAHERIQYEHYYRVFGDPAPVSQELIIPLTLELTAAEAEMLRSRMFLLEQAGVYLHSFGGNTFKVESYPYWLPRGQEREIIEEIVHWIVTEKEVDLARLRERAAIACSCKASIRANEALTMEQIESLLARLRECRNPFTCPHGRPVVVSFSNYELEKMFKRVM